MSVYRNQFNTFHFIHTKMISRVVFKDALQNFISFVPPLRLTSGIATVVTTSCVLFVITQYFGVLKDAFSLQNNILFKGHVHTLITYPFYHKTISQLFLSIGVLVSLCSSFEKSVGTVRFLFLFLLLSTWTGVLYGLLKQLQFFDDSPIEGLVPTSLIMISVTTMHTRMAKAYLFGVNVPTIVLPWFFLLIVTFLIPHTVFNCNVIAILIGWIYGKGWFSLIDMSEARACVLDKWRLFRLLGNINGLLYVPASVEKRRKTLYPRIIPTPGSYPTQAYAPVSSPSDVQASWASPNTYEGWPHPTYAQFGPIPPTTHHENSHGLGQVISLSHGHSHEHLGHSCNHSHNHNQS